ncbi:RecX family transcriptional regulator [Flavobacterium sp. MFBS3-15]|uniref:regulatory protein RecX n=1 Tax=Flavobacterium sp. MFBS3-15 TaxID=2989816 RepID=UPI00223645B6|nr:RecX family transcriptional regulator [Flavobacterium sp. MFBS3-15]MCW4470290.1 RecX family transcriptional regulator [Flavobacterium sp. MFBS3-15]
MKAMYKSYTVDEAKKKLEHYCAYQERCHGEVIQKLRSLNMIPQAIDAIVVHLIDNDFLNEERFACAFARGKFRIKQWGRTRIVNELKARDISIYNINKALREIREEEYLESFERLFEKEWEASVEKSLQKKKKKVMDFLLRKGYETHLVLDKVYNAV